MIVLRMLRGGAERGRPRCQEGVPGGRKPERVPAHRNGRLWPWAWRGTQRCRSDIITWSEDRAETRTRAPRDSWAGEVALVTSSESGCMAASEG